MDSSSLAVVDVLTAIGDAKIRLLQFAASLWARGSWSYVLGGRRSGESWGARSVRLIESIDLNDGRTLAIVLEIEFAPEAFQLAAEIETYRDAEGGGYDTEELFALPRVQARSSSEFILVLRRHVDGLCAQEGLLDRLRLARKQ